jgi:hypothetical protein
MKHKSHDDLDIATKIRVTDAITNTLTIIYTIANVPSFEY